MKRGAHDPDCPDLPDVARKFRLRSRRLTIGRQSVARILRRHGRPLTIKEIYQCVPGGECDLTTVYRSVDLLERMRMVKRIDFGDGLARYELLEEGDDGHHHHLVCTHCSEIVELKECFPKELQEKIAAAHCYDRVTHRLEFFGICPRCQRKQGRIEADWGVEE